VQKKSLTSKGDFLSVTGAMSVAVASATPSAMSEPAAKRGAGVLNSTPAKTDLREDVPRATMHAAVNTTPATSSSGQFELSPASLSDALR